MDLFVESINLSDILKDVAKEGPRKKGILVQVLMSQLSF